MYLMVSCLQVFKIINLRTTSEAGLRFFFNFMHLMGL